MDLIYDVNLPRLLDQNGNEARRINVISASVNLNITPLSTAFLELPAEESVPERAYVEMYTCNGSAGIYRARAPESAFGGANNSVQLEHAICEVGDYIIKENAEYDGPANEVIPAIFRHYGGSLWRLGDVAATARLKFTSDYGNVLQTLCEAVSLLPGYMLSFDQTVRPWTVSVVERPNTVSAEGRLSHNVVSAAIARDDSELCTRVYMRYLPNGHLDADTINTYGVVERYLDGGEGEIDEDDAQAVAAAEEEAVALATKYLEKRKHPLLTITITAQDLYQLTGEALDKIEIGKLYRLALPDYGITQEKTVTAMEWPNVYDNPGQVVITLADEVDSITSVMSSIQVQLIRTIEKTVQTQREASSLDRDIKVMARDIEVNARDIKINARDIQVNAEHIDLKAEKTVTDNLNERVNNAEIEMDAYGVRISATETNTDLLSGRMTAAEASITVQADQIKSKVSNTEFDALGKVVEQNSTAITQTAYDITLEANRAKDAENALSARITINADSITSKVDAGDIASTINQTAQSVLIQAEKINLEGYVKVDELQAKLALINYLYSPDLRSDTLHSDEAVVDNIYTDHLMLGSSDVSTAISRFGTATESGGKITIPTTTLGGTAGPDINFNIADTQFYKDAVESAYQRGAAAGSRSVSGLEKIVLGSGDIGTNVRIRDVDVFYDNDDEGSVDVLVDASAVYSAGRNDVTINKGSWSGGNIAFTKSAGTASTKTVSLAQGSASWRSGNYANIVDVPVLDGSLQTGLTVTVNAVSRYNAGYTQGSADGWEIGNQQGVANGTNAAKAADIVRTDGTNITFSASDIKVSVPLTAVANQDSAYNYSKTVEIDLRSVLNSVSFFNPGTVYTYDRDTDTYSMITTGYVRVFPQNPGNRLYKPV